VAGVLIAWGSHNTAAEGIAAGAQQHLLCPSDACHFLQIAAFGMPSSVKLAYAHVGLTFHTMLAQNPPLLLLTPGARYQSISEHFIAAHSSQTACEHSPSNSFSINLLCVNGFKQSKTIRIRLQVRAVEMTCRVPGRRALGRQTDVGN